MNSSLMERNDLRRILAANIRRLRESKQISQEELGSQAGLHRTYIGAVERAERNITLTTLVKIADALDVDPVTLLLRQGGEDQR